MHTNVEIVPSRVVLDAGPLIALFHQQDPDHSETVRGLEALTDHHAELIVPSPVVVEVYKWLLSHAEPRVARHGLQEMRAALAIGQVDPEQFDLACEVVRALPGWMGTLEDAVVALTAIGLRVPVWTLNYRDLSAFPRLMFWNP